MSANTSNVVTRFAPSPTGFLHIGGARTALFNWLYTRSVGGKFRLRIEDTDKKRSTPEAIDAILAGLEWLGIDWDGEVVYQSARAGRHAEVAQQLLDSGNAYHCYSTPEELQEMRDLARAEKRPMRYDGRWRDRDSSEAPEGVLPVVRLKAPQDGKTVIDDVVQGRVSVPNSEIDDMVLLRGDGTPTYMLSVVVDDHDMGVSHAIRGDDHLTNAFRQHHIYSALGWDVPIFAHIPLIHGADGAKLSKRHGALGVEAYRDMGYLPEALRNYLTRLGWGHGDSEIFSTEEAIKLFTLEAVGKGAARFDFKKLENLNGHYMRASDDAKLSADVRPFIEEKLERALSDDEMTLLVQAMSGLKERAKTLVELADSALFYFRKRPLALTEKAGNLLSGDAPGMLSRLCADLAASEVWSEEGLDEIVRAFAEREDMKLGHVAQPLRAALTGTTVSPGIFEVLELLGREESLARLSDQALRAA